MKKENFEQDQYYDDLEGNIRTFTVRDYSQKTKVAITSKVDFNPILKENKKRVIQEILALHPQVALPEFESYIIRDLDQQKLVWDELSLSDDGIPLENLIMQKNLMTNRNKQYLKTF